MIYGISTIEAVQVNASKFIRGNCFYLVSIYSIIAKLRASKKKFFKKLFFNCFNTCFSDPICRIKPRRFTYSPLQKWDAALTEMGCSPYRNGKSDTVRLHCEGKKYE